MNTQNGGGGEAGAQSDNQGATAGTAVEKNDAVTETPPAPKPAGDPQAETAPAAEVADGGSNQV